MTFKKYDVGEIGGGRPSCAPKNDCQVRALAVARGITWKAAWELLYAIQSERWACGFVLVDALRDGDKRLGIVEALPFPAQRGKPRMTARMFWLTHPHGHWILRMANHVAPVVDGVLLDTFNSSDKCVYAAWRLEPMK